MIASKGVMLMGLAGLSAFSSAPANAQTSKNIGYAEVVDGNSRVVGPLVSVNTVLLKIGQYNVAGFLGFSGFFIPTQYTIYYKTKNCSGSQFLTARNLPPTSAFYLNGKLYFAKPPYTSMTFQSSLVVESDPPKQSCQTETTTSVAGPIDQISTSSLGFVPPFSVRVVQP